jgi:prepilin-type N-terminal cleavage/methylation domain-containing protein
MPNYARSRHAAFTWIELLIVVVILGVIGAMGLSAFETRSTQALTMAEMLAADVSFARAEAIARPDLGCIIKFDVTDRRYWLARPAQPDAPITNPITRAPYVVRWGKHGPAQWSKVEVTELSLGENHVLTFDSLGGLSQSGAAKVVFGAGKTRFGVSIDPVVGIATVAEEVEVNNGEVIGEGLEVPPLEPL